VTDIETLLKAMELKDEKRSGWQIKGIENPESVADHSWGTTFLCLVFGPDEDIDLERTLKIATVHDLAEAETGDIASRADEELQEISSEEKFEIEDKAITGFASELEKPEIRKLWQEYESQDTEEAKFVKDMDKIDMLIQALKYEEEERYSPERDNDESDEFERLDEFFANSSSKIKTGKGEKLFQQIKERYEESKKD